MYVIMVSNAYTQMTHGPWRDESAATKAAQRWNRAYAKQGWNLRASVVPLLDKSASTRDRIGVALAEMAERSRRDERLRLEAVPCPCFEPDIDPGTVSEENPDGVCACGHVADEHDPSGTCDGMVLPEGATHG